MTARILDMRLKKLERSAQLSALSGLTDQELDAQIVETLAAVAAPYGGDVRAMIADMRATPDPTERELAGQIENLMDDWNEMGLPPLH
ncbi:hypothetical protein ASG52_24585 [Methylobacterium sp. Leaf456]|uniref:hypothetical protein n=1 Tax=Methylobacterium sp. Leaf456 TaxID=1736382 RepID=UPI0006F9C28C|nr:hypothetical protein [Methylobacterium sp. Leaf456]KQT56098.1 hypothetical protein ASG52_24585 [Methylobacterium sp. Leaf456]